MRPRMRLIAPVLVDSRIRGRIVLKSIEDKGEGRSLFTFDITAKIPYLSGRDAGLRRSKYVPGMAFCRLAGDGRLGGYIEWSCTRVFDGQPTRHAKASV